MEKGIIFKQEERIIFPTIAIAIYIDKANCALKRRKG